MQPHCKSRNSCTGNRNSPEQKHPWNQGQGGSWTEADRLLGLNVDKWGQDSRQAPSRGPHSKYQRKVPVLLTSSKETTGNTPEYSVFLNRVCPQERLLKSLTSWGKNTIQLEHPPAILSHLKGEKTWEAPVGFTVQRPRITQHWDPKATPSISHHQISTGLFTQTLYPVITPGYQEKKIYEQLQEPQQTLEPDSDTVKVLVTQLC